MVMEGSNTLHQSLGKEFYETLMMRPEKKDFVITTQATDPGSSSSSSSSHEKNMERIFNNNFVRVEAQLNTTLVKFVSTIKTHSIIITANDPVEAVKSQVYNFTYTDYTKMGILKERQLWLRHLLGKYNVESKLFIIDPQNYDVYIKELEEADNLMLHYYSK